MLLSEVGKLREERRTLQQCVLLINHNRNKAEILQRVGVLAMCEIKIRPRRGIQSGLVSISICASVGVIILAVR